ncbi:cupin domain-containing protein [Streptomyces celluloflavus]|uniref:cupin domain-containing protein n=1 Tax=Streptomyces celluloflavus TaxID=58344 RepID=UPI00368FCBBC
MITKFRLNEDAATREFGMACQRVIPWQGQDEEPPLGAMACFLPAGASSEPDCHDQDEVMIITSGAGRLDLAGEEGTFEAGDVVVLPRKHEHVVHNPGTDTLVWVSLYWPLREPQPDGPEPGPRSGA